MPTRAIYTYSQIQRDLNAKLHGRRKNLVTTGDTVAGDSNLERDLINSGARIAMSEVDFRGNIREITLNPALSDCQWSYDAPNDLKADQIIDFRPQVTDSRGEFETYDPVSREEFDRRKRSEWGIYTVTDDDLTRRIRISANIDNESLQLSSMEDTTWTAYSANSVNDSDVKLDQADYTEGNGGIRWQTDTSDSTDSTVGIQNTDIGAGDLSTYLAGGSVFVDGRLTTYDTGIHSATLRLGTDSSNYYEITDSTQNDCSTFETGWNKIRWDLNNRSTAGTPTDTALNYVALFWNRDTTDTAALHTEDTNWGFDNLQLTKGRQYLLSYYTRNVWQDTDFSLVENSTHDSHALLVQNDEYELILAKIAEVASGYLRDREGQQYYAAEYQRMKQEYMMNNPSEAGVKTYTYHDFSSLESRFSRDSDS